MRVYQVRGYPPNHYFVQHDDWRTMLQWLWQNNVGFLQESSSPHGIGFSIRKNFEWFALKFLPVHDQ